MGQGAGEKYDADQDVNCGANGHFDRGDTVRHDVFNCTAAAVALLAVSHTPRATVVSRRNDGGIVGN